MGGSVLVGHADADRFYVEAERLRRRFLVGKPLAVLGNQGACVIARSREMSAAGVEVGDPVWEARKKCPDGIFLKRDFRWYGALSRRLLAALRGLTPRVEYYSIDEFFFEAEPLPGRPWVAAARHYRDRLWEETGLPVTVGLARSRTLAKLLSDAAKPFGARALVDDGEERALLAELPVTAICGIAGRRAKALEPAGIKTCLDFINADPMFVRKALTVVGARLWYELRGESVIPLQSERPAHKTLSRGGSLGPGTTDPNVLWGWAVRNTERLAEELDYHETRAGRVEVWLGYQSGRRGMGVATLTAPASRFDLVLDAVRAGLHQAWLPGEWARRMELVASDLRPRGFVQTDLFAEPAAQASRAEAVDGLKREVNGRVGRFALRSGATLWLGRDLYRDEAAGFDVCDIRGKLCF